MNKFLRILMWVCVFGQYLVTIMRASDFVRICENGRPSYLQIITLVAFILCSIACTAFAVYLEKTNE